MPAMGVTGDNEMQLFQQLPVIKQINEEFRDAVRPSFIELILYLLFSAL